MLNFLLSIIILHFLSFKTVSIIKHESYNKNIHNLFKVLKSLSAVKEDLRLNHKANTLVYVWLNVQEKFKLKYPLEIFI